MKSPWYLQSKPPKFPITPDQAKNLGLIVLGVALFYFSFWVGESTLIGGLMHLSGCAVFCLSLHKIVLH